MKKIFAILSIILLTACSVGAGFNIGGGSSGIGVGVGTGIRF